MKCDTRTILGFPAYSITKDGRVWSEPRRDKLRRQCGNKWLTLRLKPNGYRVVDLCKNSKPHTCYVHRLVLETYVGPFGLQSLPQRRRYTTRFS